VFNFARNLRVKQRGIEGFNAGNTAAAGEQRLPRLRRGIADGGYETDARDYDSAGNNLELLFFDLLARACHDPLPGSNREGGERGTDSRGKTHSVPDSMPEADAGMPRGTTTFSCFRCR
jgi:hypothetical protein